MSRTNTLKRPAAIQMYAVQCRGRRGHLWLSSTTISRLKRDAIPKMIPSTATPAWRAEVARRKKTGEVKAVPVVIMTLEEYRELVQAKS